MCHPLTLPGSPREVRRAHRPECPRDGIGLAPECPRDAIGLAPECPRDGIGLGRVRRAHRLFRYGLTGCMAGLTYVEVLVAIVLIMVVLIPALDALQPGVTGAGIHESRSEDHHRLAGHMEFVLAQPFVELDAAVFAAGSPATPSSYSDIVTYASGRQVTRNVFLSRYDADNADADNDPFTGTEDDLIWVRVEIAGTTEGIEGLISAYD